MSTAVVAMGLDPTALDEPENHLDLNSFRRKAAGVQPDVGLLIADLHEAGRLWSLLNITSHTDIPWILLSNSVPPAVEQALITSGVLRILPAQISLTALHEVLTEISSATRPVVRTSTPTGDDRDDELLAARLGRLSARELAVLEKLAEGLSVQVISQREGVSEGTVRSQVKAVRSKLEVKSQLQAVAQYRRINNWFTPRAGDTDDE